MVVLCLSISDIDLITPILNEYMQKLDKENFPGYCFTTDYWNLMLKLHTIRSSLTGDIK